MERTCRGDTQSSSTPKDKREAFCATLGSTSEEDVPVRKNLEQKRHEPVSSSGEDQGPSTSKTQKQKRSGKGIKRKKHLWDN
jgi:hypothetical protein